MRIDKPKAAYLNSAQAIADLELLLSQPNARQLRPCPNCTESDGAECSPACTGAPASLSTDPDRYPVEPHVVPMVYELNVTRLMQPCWSCEGHANAEGTLLKLPLVSFYAFSPVYPQLLMNYLHNLILAKKLAYPWQIVLTDYGQTWGITYSIEPRLSYGVEPRHDLLMNDLKVISADLAEKIKHEASAMLDKVKDSLVDT